MIRSLRDRTSKQNEDASSAPASKSVAEPASASKTVSEPVAGNEATPPFQRQAMKFPGEKASVHGQLNRVDRFASSMHGQQGSADTEDKKLIVGRNIQLKGEITACDTLVVEGRIEASVDSQLIQVAETGVYIGDATIDTAEIAGRFEGKLVAKRRLVIQSTGRVSGTINYGEIIIEAGGKISGNIEEIEESAKVTEPIQVADSGSESNSNGKTKAESKKVAAAG